MTFLFVALLINKTTEKEKTATIGGVPTHRNEIVADLKVGVGLLPLSLEIVNDLEIVYGSTKECK